MSDHARTLTYQEAQTYYNRFGAKQDSQGFYEAPATRDLIAHAAFETAQSVFELGCGTGAFAERLLTQHLPEQASYRAVDSSRTMIDLAQARLARFGDRVGTRLTDGSLTLDEVAPGSCDRFVSCYVLDLLSAADITALLAQAHQLLQPGGRVCLVGLTHGVTWVGRCVMGTWQRIHTFRPALVGGCRPLELRAFLSESHWQLEYRKVITAFGVASEVVVASKRLPGGDEAREARAPTESEEAHGFPID